MLKTNPELVHLSEVLDDKVDGVLHAAILARVLFADNVDWFVR